MNSHAPDPFSTIINWRPSQLHVKSPPAPILPQADSSDLLVLPWGDGFSPCLVLYITTPNKGSCVWRALWMFQFNEKKNQWKFTWYLIMLVAQSCPTLCDPMDHSPPGSSVHGILQARILEQVAIPFSRGSSRPWVSCTAGDSLPSEPPGKLNTW